MNASIPADRIAAETVPQVAVITLTYNRPDAVRRCLESLRRQTLPGEAFEVVLIDVSDQPVNAAVEAYSGCLRIKHLHAVNQGVAGNRNLAAQHTRAPLLSFIDDDCVADPDWLAELLAAARAHPGELIGGSVGNMHPDNAVSRAGQVITEAVDGCFNPPGSKPTFFAGLNFAVPRDAYQELGGCDARFGRLAAEDRDFADRWLASGRSMVRAADARVRHDHRADLPGFIRQYFNYGRGARRYHALRRRRGHARFGESIRTHLRLARQLCRQVRILPREMQWRVALLLLVWELANGFGFAWQAVVDRVHRAH